MLVNSVCAVSFCFSNLILELDRIEMPMMIRVLIGFDFLFLRSTDCFKNSCFAVRLRFDAED